VMRDLGSEESRQKGRKPFATVEEERGGKLHHMKHVVLIRGRRTLLKSKLVLM